LWRKRGDHRAAFDYGPAKNQRYQIYQWLSTVKLEGLQEGWWAATGSLCALIELMIARRYDLEPQEDPEAAAEDYMWGLLRAI